MKRSRTQRGFTLVELLVAMGITMAVAAAVLALVASMSAAFRVQPEVQDLHQRLRVAVETLQRDLYGAGAGVSLRAAPGPVHHYWAPVRPYRVGERRADPPAGVFYRDDAIALFALSGPPGQALVRGLHAVGGTLAVDAEPNCGQFVHDRLCGFAAGAHAVVFDRTGRLSIGTVTRVDGTTVFLEGPQVHFDIDAGEGAVLAELSVRVYHLAEDAATGVPRLMQYDGRGSELPAIDHVVGLQFEYFGDPVPPALLPDVNLADPRGPWTAYGPAPPPVHVDRPDAWDAGENCIFGVLEGAHVPRLAALGPGPGLVLLRPEQLTDGPWCPDAVHPERFDADLLRIRRVRTRIRVEAAPAWLRGPAGPFFSRGGTAPPSGHRVPDVELVFDVAPRNLGLSP